MKRVTCTVHSTWCIMICLVIPILSLLLFIQSLFSLSKLHIFVTSRPSPPHMCVYTYTYISKLCKCRRGSSCQCSFCPGSSWGNVSLPLHLFAQGTVPVSYKVLKFWCLIRVQKACGKLWTRLPRVCTCTCTCVCTLGDFIHNI